MDTNCDSETRATSLLKGKFWDRNIRGKMDQPRETLCDAFYTLRKRCISVAAEGSTCSRSDKSMTEPQNVLVNPDATHDKSSRAYVVSWVNNLLKTDYSDVRQLCSGLSQCQIMNIVCPGSIDTTKLKFKSHKEEDNEQNFNLLQKAFNRNGIIKTLPVKDLITGDFRSNYELLKWFRLFYMANMKKQRAYHHVDVSQYNYKTQHNSSIRTNGILTHNIDPSKACPYTDQWKEQFEWAHSSALGEQFTYCKVCHRNLKTFLRGTVDLIRHSETNFHRKRLALFKSRAALNQNSLPCSETAIQFIYYPKNITSLCEDTPYSLYILGGKSEEQTKVVLVGHFDAEEPKYCIQFLDAFEALSEGTDQKEDTVVEILNKFKLPSSNLTALYMESSDAASEHILSQLRKHRPNMVSFGSLLAMADIVCDVALKELSNKTLEMLVDIHNYHTSCPTKNDKLSSLFVSEILDSSSFDNFIKSCLNLYPLVCRLLEMWADLTSYFEVCSTEDEKAKLICSQLQDPRVRAKYMILTEAVKPLHSFQTHLLPQKEELHADLVIILEQASKLLQTYTSCFLEPEAELQFLNEKDDQILKNTDSLSLHTFLKESDCEDAFSPLQQEALSLYIALTSNIAGALPLSAVTLRSIAQLLNPQSTLTVSDKDVEDIGVKLDVCSSPEERQQLREEFVQYQLAAKDKTAEDTTAEDKPAEDTTAEDKPAEDKTTETKMTEDKTTEDKTTEDIAIDDKTEENKTETTEDKPSEDKTEEDKTIEDKTAEDKLIEDIAIEDIRQTHREKHEEEQKYVAGVSLEEHWANVLKELKPSSIFRKLILTLLALPRPPLDSNKIINKDVTRGSYGWENSLRQKPQVRTIYQAGSNTWSKTGDEKDSQDEVTNQTESPSNKTPRGRRKQTYQDGKGFLTGELVWGKLKGFTYWPGLVKSWKTKSSPPGMRRVEWFGDGMFSERIQRCFNSHTFSCLSVYKEAVFQALELAAERCGKSFTMEAVDKERELKEMLRWAHEGFLPTGPNGFMPPETMVDSLKEERSTGKTLEDFCLSCGTPETAVRHPLFEGSLCAKCKENFTETLYRYDEDGYQSYCTFAALDSRLFSVKTPAAAAGTFDQLKEVAPWHCYMCKPSECKGSLKLRPDWSIRVQDFFANNSAFEFEPHRLYPAIPAGQRRPIRVLSLFDGIATGYLVLKDLGFKIDRYIASEICEDSIAVGMVKHAGKIEYVMMFAPSRGNIGNDKADICRFLECNPILIDAVKVSPAHRARYFWGNLPGMNRPLASSLGDKANLQDCLEPGRVANFDKVRTITTKSNSLRQAKSGPLPVQMNGKEDSLWCTELEQ
ncbi:hypothetical protein WMY93_031443 [Mugilogobius chulae]|uniref:DNA (cytosine-5-)-methyltransferase n=1 Tax=Mugilogobius chulae TaxID=88201 RepID=A0AAW0MMD3_9GOBI